MNKCIIWAVDNFFKETRVNKSGTAHCLEPGKNCQRTNCALTLQMPELMFYAKSLVDLEKNQYHIYYFSTTKKLSHLHLSN